MPTAGFLNPVYPGDTLSTTSEIIGLKENSSGRTGVVYVRSIGRNQHGGVVLNTCAGSWSTSATRKARAGNGRPGTARAGSARSARRRRAGAEIEGYDTVLAGSPHAGADYEPGERIDHFDGVTVEEAEHQMATRLYHNTARVHFNQHSEKDGRFGRRLVYGGHVISMARALSFNGLANAFHVTAINAGRHVGPVFAGDTFSLGQRVLAREEIAGRSDIGALRLRTVATKNRVLPRFSVQVGDATFDPSVVLELDYWVVLPR